MHPCQESAGWVLTDWNNVIFKKCPVWGDISSISSTVFNEMTGTGKRQFIGKVSKARISSGGSWSLSESGAHPLLSVVEEKIFSADVRGEESQRHVEGLD